MYCNSCKKNVTGTIPGNMTRCLHCGILLTKGTEITQPKVITASKHLYQTPYGKTLAQLQKSGNWVAVSCIIVPETSKASASRVVSNLVVAWREIDNPLIAKAHSFDEANLRFTWLLPKVENAVPLLNFEPTLQIDIIKLVKELATQLTHLHKLGFSAFDLSPSMIFLPKTGGQPFFVPTPWLASQAIWNPEALKSLPFVAPELEECDQFYPDPVRADLYSLGSLAWFLLTGEYRRQYPSKLPSEHSPQLKKWDEFIDGCCRSNPLRRFESVTNALESLESKPSFSEPLPKKPNKQLTDYPQEFPPQKPEPIQTSAKTRERYFPNILQFSSRRTITYCIIIFLAMVSAVVSLRHDLFGLQFIGLSNLLTPYQRGFGGTILQYMDRTYENASWKKIKEAESLSQLAEISDLKCITGWDENNYYVLAENGRVFQCKSGHWTTSVKPNAAENPTARILNNETIMIAGNGLGRKHLYILSPKGLEDCGDLDYEPYSRHICSIAPDLIYCFSPFYLDENGVYKISNGKMTYHPESKFKESFVHRVDNTPLKEYLVRGIKHSISPIEGRAFGFCGKWDGGKFTDLKVVTYRNGYWYTVDDLPKNRAEITVNDVWYNVKLDQLISLILIGTDGFVYSHTFDGLKTEIPVSMPPENTSLNLIKVWAASSKKFWVMDKNGTVWERIGTDWRVVVRGLHRDDVEFIDAWVSPRGSVYAITKKHVYRLD